MVKKVKRIKLHTNREHKWGYYLLNIAFGTIFFLLGYVLHISKLDHNFEQLILIIAWMTITGILASFICRFIMKYWDFDKTFNFYTRSIFSVLISSILIFLGLYSTMFQKYEISANSLSEFWGLLTSEVFWEFLLVIFLVKLFVFFAADYFSDKIAFGG
jgi:hypothetical protein